MTANIYVKACINGARTPDAHPNLPVSPAQLAAAAVQAHEAGAQAVHMHPKTTKGNDSLEPDVVGAAVEAVRAALPGLPVGVTTGFWALPDAAARRRAVEGWTALPDFASVNWHEPGSAELAETLLGKGVGVEAGLFDVDAVAAWARSPLARHCMRAMIELPGDADVAAADDMLARVRAVASPAPVLLHGQGESCWALVEHAGVVGVQTRIGLEDTLTLPDGSIAPDNGALVSAAVRLLGR